MSALGDVDLAAPADERGGGERPTVAGHPRASRHIRLAKGWGGLLGFAVVALLSWRAGMDAFEAGLRALAAGVVGFMAAWAATLFIWRIVVEAEHRIAAREAQEAAGGGRSDAPGLPEA